MGKVWKKGAAVVLAFCVCAGALSGCGKKSDAVSAFKFNSEKVDGDLTNFVLRFEQSSLDDIYAYYGSMMQQDIWSMDDGQGLGITTWDNFKTGIGEDLEKLLLAEEHAPDYNVSLTDDEKKAIADAAAKFIAANDEKVLSSMSATQEVVERYLTLSTIKSKVDVAIGAEADTEVSDEEAAQRTVSYIEYTPSTETETEAESESEESLTEADEENTVQAGEKQDAQTMTEGETSMVETEESKKTKASGGSSETEDKETEAEQAVTEAEAVSESETEDPVMAEAEKKYYEMAEDMLAAITGGEIDFVAAVDQVNGESVTGVMASSFTFGKDDSTPDAAIIEATNDLADDTLVDHLVKAGDSYYILHVDSAFDEEATGRKKEEIVEQRKQDKVDETYEKWMADEKFEVDSEKLAAVLKDRSYTAPVSNETEASQGVLMTEETELHMEVTFETEITVETETETES